MKDESTKNDIQHDLQFFSDLTQLWNWAGIQKSSYDDLTIIFLATGALITKEGLKKIF